MKNVKIHSVVDLITNSSTVIYTYSEDSEAVVRELVEEMLLVFGSDKKFDDLFKTVVMFASDSIYNRFKPTGMQKEEVSNIISKVRAGELKKPEWMITAESSNVKLDDYSPSTTLHLIVKDTKYEKLAQKLINFLYSTNHDGGYDG